MWEQLLRSKSHKSADPSLIKLSGHGTSKNNSGTDKTPVSVHAPLVGEFNQIAFELGRLSLVVKSN